jgi:type VI secretion system secreted protein Hcp
MASDIFFKIGDIKGESGDEKHKGEIEVLSWSWGVSNGGTMATGGGGGAGKANFTDLTFTHHVDKASPNLWMNCAVGKHIPDATLTQRKSGGKQEEYLKIKLTDVLVSSVQDSGADGAGHPSESVSLNFAKVEWEYSAQKSDGSLDAATKVGFDLKKNVKV